MVSLCGAQHSEFVQAERRVTCRRTVAAVVGAAVSLIAVATSVEAQVVADSGAPPAPAAQEQTASTPPDPNLWRTVKFGATLEGYYQYNWNRPPDRTLVLRAYDTRSNTFGIARF